MNGYAPMGLRVHDAYREDDWRHADAWRRLHRRPDAPPLPTARAVDEAPRSRLGMLLRVIVRHA